MYWFVNGWRAWYSQNLCEYKNFVESVFYVAMYSSMELNVIMIS
jgi:hypothetical protein